MLKDRLYFYASYYRPQNTRENRANLYGELPQYESTRNEGFGKLTFTPSRSILLNASYRDSKRVDTSDLFVSNAAATTGSGSEARLKIGTADGSWVIGSRSYATFKYTHFSNGPWAAGPHRPVAPPRGRGWASRTWTAGEATVPPRSRPDRVQRLIRVIDR